MRTIWLVLAANFYLVAVEARPFPYPTKQLTNYAQPPRSAEEHYQAGLEAVRAADWATASQELEYVRHGHPDSSLVKEALYQLGVAYYSRGALFEANRCFLAYLDRDMSPRHFTEVFSYKLQIADQWHHGRRKHLIDLHHLPRWQGARGDALDLYEEIFTSLPGHDLGAEALYQSAELHATLREYREAIEGHQMFLQRFPKHAHAPRCFLQITLVYLRQAEVEVHNPDLLPLAEINVRKFRQEFPTDERLLEAERLLGEMREVFATGLTETGHFYERIKNPVSAAVYYRAVLDEFPRTEAAIDCRVRLAALDLPDDES